MGPRRYRDGGGGVRRRFRSRSSRSAVRFFAAASDAFLARAERSAAVMLLAAVFPPFDPIAAIACRSSVRVSRILKSYLSA